MNYSALGFGFMLSPLMILWSGLQVSKPTLILATIGAIIIVIDYLLKTINKYK